MVWRRDAISSLRYLAGNPSTNNPQPARPIPVTRAHNQSTVSQTPASTLPLTPEDLIDLTEPPPGYTPSANPNISLQALMTQLTTLETSLAARNKGSLSLRPYTSTGGIDAVQLLYAGMTQIELTSRELGTPIYLHPSFSWSAHPDYFAYS